MENVKNNMIGKAAKIIACLAVMALSYTAEAQTKQRFLLLTTSLELEATTGIDLMYNFKFDEASVEFAKIKKRHPDHPLPYFLMAMNNWWKMLPYMEYENPVTEPWAKEMMSYIDTTITKAEYYYDIDSVEVEAAFFLSAAYGLKARYYAERGDKMAAIMPSKHALKYFKRTHEESDMSPEFLFGSALINYYGEWFREEYPGLKPVLILFPKGNKQLGLTQLKECSNNAFYTRTEALYFLMRIYYLEEGKTTDALPIARYLAGNYPDNSYFERMLARFCFYEGQWHESERLCKDILYKYDIKMPGYEDQCARYACFFLAYIYRHGYKNTALAKEYYLRVVLYGERTNATHMNYYLTSVTELARMANEDKDIASARAYYKTVRENASKKDDSILWKEADAYLKKTKKQVKK